MHIVRTAAHARNSAPPFAVVAQQEFIKVRQLPAWARWLFLELVAMSDFKTGAVSTSYAQLVALLGCDQPQTGGRRLDEPTLKQVRTGLDWLVAMNLIARDSERNEKQGHLRIFIVQVRASVSASNASKGRGKGRVKNAQNTDEHRAQPKVIPSEGQGLGQVFQHSSSKEKKAAPPVDNLATGRVREQLKKTAREMRKTLRARPQKSAPQGANTPPLRGTPPVVPALARLGDVLGGGSHQAPPGGQTNAPAGHAPEGWEWPGTVSQGSPAWEHQARRRERGDT